MSYVFSGISKMIIYFFIFSEIKTRFGSLDIPMTGIAITLHSIVWLQALSWIQTW